LSDDILLKNPVQIEESEIEEIIFGLRTPGKMKVEIIDIIKGCCNYGANVKIYEMIKIDKMNKLNRVRIS
jgi:hypothetical protein